MMATNHWPKSLRTLGTRLRFLGLGAAILEIPRVKPGDQPLANETEDPWYDLAFP